MSNSKASDRFSDSRLTVRLLLAQRSKKEILQSARCEKASKQAVAELFAPKKSSR